MKILVHLCPAAFSGNYNEKEEIAKVINSYEDVTVYYDKWYIGNILGYFKEHCKHAKFENMRSPVYSKQK